MQLDIRAAGLRPTKIAKTSSSIPKGFTQSTVTPMTSDFEIDVPTFEKVIDFHVRTGASAIAWPLHKSESLNLSTAERKLGAEIVTKTVNGRLPVIIFASALSTADTKELAQHAEKVGADGINVITPYYWGLTEEAILDHFINIGSSVGLPMMAYNSPGLMSGVEITPRAIEILIEKLPNLGGVKEVSFNGEKFTEFCRASLSMRPDFTIMTGVEYLLPSFPLGGSGSYSAGGAVCPNLIGRLHRACLAGDWEAARPLQYAVSRIWLLFRDNYPSSLKGGMALMGRPVGPTRSPLPTASPQRINYIRTQLEELNIFDTEPSGW
jgi:dihydrodipicolinate synthase/N-acetylneuraminate lyase